MEEKSFLFISCVNNSVYERECAFYINRLKVPSGYKCEYVSVYGAKSMASGYNEAMKTSDAKYKIYLHQDVFIINENFLFDLLEIFNSDKSIGMVGMVGPQTMPKSGVMWDNNDMVGMIYSSILWETGESFFGWADRPYSKVVCADGLLLATSVDIPWREDLFTGFDFYDASQCFEMRKKGYKVVVPYMEKPWVFHDSRVLKMDNYDYYRNIFLKEYL